MNKKDHVFNTLYADHLNRAGRFKTNSTRNRLFLLQQMYERMMQELCMNRFTWSNLPDDIDSRFIERELFGKGLAVFLHHERFDKFMVLRASPSGGMDYQDNPLSYIYSGNQVLHGEVPATECVPIWSNYMRFPDTDIVHIYSTRLAEMSRTIEINSLNARLPKLLAASEDSRLSSVNIQRLIDAGEHVVMVGDRFDPATVEVLDMGINPDMIVNLQIARTREWSEAMTLLGIKNANQDKKERLVSDEVAANDEQIGTYKNVALRERMKAVEKINKKYGLNVAVDMSMAAKEVDEELGGLFDELFHAETENGS